MKMKAAVYYGPGDVRYEDRDKPEPGETGAVVRVGACGICPLIDVPHYKTSFPLPDIPPGYHKDPVKMGGIVLGHEYSGEVVEVGARVKDLKPGDRIYGVMWGPCGKCDACKAGDYEHCPFGDGGGRVTDGAMAEYVLLPDMTYSSIIDDKVIHLPEGVTYRDGALIEILRLGIGLASKAKAGETVVVFGQDLIGLTAVARLKAIGAAKVIAVDVSPKRLNAARDLGADMVLNEMSDNVLEAVMDATSGGGAETVIESSCRPENLQQAVNVVHTFGHIWLGTFYTAGPFFNPSFTQPNLVSMNPTQKAGVSLHCPWGTLGPWKPMLEQAMDFLRKGTITADKYVTHVYPLDKARDAFEMALNPYDSIKVMLEP